MTDEELIREIEEQRSVMVAVSTGGYSDIPRENDGYKARRDKIRAALASRQIADPNPHNDLRRWYGKWSSGDLPTYKSRRTYVDEMYDPLIDLIEARASQVGSELFVEPTGWPRVDRNVDRIRATLETANAEEDFQAVGMFCRECIISLAQAIYDPASHAPQGFPVPSETDANRMIEAWLSQFVPGDSNEEIRRSVKASLVLANSLTHRRTAGFVDAALCAETSISLVNLVAILSGRRSPA